MPAVCDYTLAAAIRSIPPHGYEAFPAESGSSHRLQAMVA
jgi:hypothetical protein